MPEKKYLDVEGTQHLVGKIETDLSYSEATTTASGLMSAADKTKLDGIYPNALKMHIVSADTSGTTVQWKKFISGTFGTSGVCDVHLVFKTSESATEGAQGDSEYFNSVLHVRMRYNNGTGHLTNQLMWEYANSSILFDDFKICVSKTDHTFECYWRVVKGYQGLYLQTITEKTSGTVLYDLVNEDMGSTEPSSEFNAYSTVKPIHPDMLAGCISSLNLIDNSNFRVNQRGQSEYITTAATVPSVDRWKIHLNTKIIIDGDTITISNNDLALDNRAIHFFQTLPYAYSDLAGEDVTLSICDADDVVYTATAKAPTYQPASDTPICRHWITSNLLLELLWSATDKRFNVNLYSGNFTGTFSFKWMKLELGDVATLYTPPNPALELLKCQRYYQRISGIWSYIGCGGIGSFTSGTKYASVIIHLPTPLRVNPTLTIFGTLYVNAQGHMGLPTIEHTNNSIMCRPTTVEITRVIETDDDSIIGYSAFCQIRDDETYIELSADL